MEQATQQSKDPAAGDKSPPRLSITVLNYNYGRYLPACLESILSQSFRDFELIVIDDKSTDDSVERVQPYLADSRVRFIKHDVNAGYRSSLIEGTETHSRGEFLMVFSADDVVRRNDALEIQMAALDENPDAAFCFSAYDRFDDETGEIIDYVRAYDDDCLVPGEQFFRDYATLHRVHVMHSGTIIRREAYQKAGGYPRDLSITLDFAMWLLLSLEGPVAYCNDVLYGYRRHLGQMSQASQKVHKNALELVSSIERACDKARSKGLPVANAREAALRYQLLIDAISEAFSEQRSLSLLRLRSAFLLRPWLTLTSKGLLVVIARLALGQRGYAFVRSSLTGKQ